MVSVLASILLGILQGLTEWFPVSSSGHLVLFQQLFRIDVPLAFNVYLHLGTIFVLITYFWRDIKLILKDVLSFKFTTKNGLLGLYIIIGSLCTMIIGLLFYDFFRMFFTKLIYVGYAFLFTGVLLFLSRYVPARNNKMGYGSAVAMGIAQGISLIPGVSRSGATISAGMLSGTDRLQAARFSFLLAIPAVLGAAVIDTMNNASSLLVFLQQNLLATLLGVFFSALVGWFTLKGLLWIIKRGNFHYFSYYCLVLGLLIVTKILA